MNKETIKKEALAGLIEITSAVNDGEMSILEEWENKTQIIGLFLTKGSKKNYLVGFNIRDKFNQDKELSFAPSYKQILSFLSALDVWQFKPKKDDEKFWLGVAFNALMALSKRDEEYDTMLEQISKKLKNKEMDKKVNFEKR